LGLAYLPWLSTALAMRQRRVEHVASHWRWGSVVERWQDLTVGCGTSCSGWGGAVALLLVLLGITRAVRTAAGRAVLAAALCGTVGVELLLLHANHWSSPRYDLIGWLFLPVLAGMGAGLLMRLRGGRAMTTLVLLLLVLAQALGIVRDHHLRQDWRRVAEAVDKVWRPGEPVLTQNRSTNTLVLYYLRELRSPAAAAVAPWAAPISAWPSSGRRTAARSSCSGKVGRPARWSGSRRTPTSSSAIRPAARACASSRHDFVSDCFAGRAASIPWDARHRRR
jgi:hypothetical protein